MSGNLVLQQELFPLKEASSFKDDLELMSLPFFSISKSPRHTPIEHRYNIAGFERYVRVTGGEKGIATVWDNDILIYARTLIMKRLDAGMEPSNRVAFNVYDFLVATGRQTSGSYYARFLDGLVRLKTTTVTTNIAAGDFVEETGFGWLQSYRLRKHGRRGEERIAVGCEIVLCDWIFNAIISQRVLTVRRPYFQITGGLERKLYLIINRHLGNQKHWTIGVEKLRERCGAENDLRRFRYDLKKIVEADGFEDFTLKLSPWPTGFPLSDAPKRGAMFLHATPRPPRLSRLG